MKKLPSLLLPLLLLLAAGCASTGREYDTRMIRKSPEIAPATYGKDLRHGGRAAIIGFNSQVMAGKTQRTNVDEVGRITGSELRGLTDAMLHTFVAEFAQIPGLEVKPISEITKNGFYDLLDYPRGDQSLGFTLITGNGRRVAPRGLKYIKVPHSRMEEQSGVFFLADIGKNLNRDFQADLNHLCHKLEVDVVIIVNNQVELHPGEGGIDVELKLVELVVVGYDVARRYAYANHVAGPFSRVMPQPRGPVPAEIAAITNPGEAHDFTDADFAENPFWKPLEGPYQNVVTVFRQHIENLRD
ncbi:MAG: hypothetical protein ACI8W8_000718 [Rhodothermales bacterium]|jgi:hypothetical protein